VFFFLSRRAVCAAMTESPRHQSHSRSSLYAHTLHSSALLDFSDFFFIFKTFKKSLIKLIFFCFRLFDLGEEIAAINWKTKSETQASQVEAKNEIRSVKSLKIFHHAVCRLSR
jgi:hypothetical protein